MVAAKIFTRSSVRLHDRPGEGQFRLESGEIIEEKSKLLILLHLGSDVDSKEIEEIRAAYIDRFDQQSVLRTDEPSCVSF